MADPTPLKESVIVRAGGPATVKARAETTNGTITALEVVVPPTRAGREACEAGCFAIASLSSKRTDQMMDGVDTMHHCRGFTGEAPA